MVIKLNLSWATACYFKWGGQKTFGFYKQLIGVQQKVKKIFGQDFLHFFGN